MANTLWRCLLRSIAAVLFTIVCAGGADAVVSISACGTLSVRETYNLTADLHAMGGDCLVVANNGIVINLQGHSVIQDQATPFGAGITDGGIARDGTVVKGKGTVTGFVFGIELDSSTRNQILNVTVSDSALDGIFVGDSSLVKGCSIDSNGFGDILGGDGIHGKSRVQVEASVVSNNGANGIRVGQGCLVTGNTADENFGDGINTAASCTVTSNKARNNDVDGIDVGSSKSVVSVNQTDDNFDVGTRVVCPSTVTNNRSSGNFANYAFVGTNCTLVNNQ